MPNIVLGVTGSISAYRAADLARELMRHGCTVRVCLTPAGEKFVSRVLFESLTGQPCLMLAFDEPEAGRMAHIEWARQADALVVAPATANILCKIAMGVADDMLSTIALAFTGPMVLAPAMNPSMYAAAPTQEAIRILKSRAAAFVDPAHGEVACGEQGEGKLAAIADIVKATMDVVACKQRLVGKKVLITSGPTREPIDDVRYVSNKSSGKMGAALARAALLMGADVVVISGPGTAPMPFGAEVKLVETAQEMLFAAMGEIQSADYVIGAAAVADYRPAHPVKGKLRRINQPMSLDLTPNPDIIAELAKAAKPGAKLIGFAAEPEPDLEVAKSKLARKGLAAIAVNNVAEPGIGFDSDENDLTLIYEDGTVESSGKMSKLACALWLLGNVT
jgi:phosphopantothenoylcysteine decarboxylase/phosphopantothenate--cysteine ligase